ncbi:carboxypeptidase-like regulatory domain-containing protein [Bremerella sp. JC817]|uniref:carboxypeptidase-like regulatory domain-containing protein n=1 Tax=Bremerella sp. JC817 TaxID=3231756 RepID=UPI00345AF0F6
MTNGWIAAKSLLAALMLVALIGGCGSKKDDKWTRGRPPVYRAFGTVTYQGNPVADAVVTFQPTSAEGGKGGSALTDSRGYFEARTFESGDGLTEGTHRVAISKVQLVDAQGNIVTEIREPIGLREKNLVPKKYSDFKKSEIEVTINADGANDLGEIVLKD